VPWCTWEKNKFIPEYPHINNGYNNNGNLDTIDNELSLNYNVSKEELATDIYAFKDTSKISKGWSESARYYYYRMVSACGPRFASFLNNPIVRIWSRLALLVVGLFTGGFLAKWLFGKFSEWHINKKGREAVLKEMPSISPKYDDAGLIGKWLIRWGLKSLDEPAATLAQYRKTNEPVEIKNMTPQAIVSLAKGDPMLGSVRELLTNIPTHTEIPEKFKCDDQIAPVIVAILNNTFAVQVKTTIGMWQTIGNILFMADNYAVTVSHVAFLMTKHLRNKQEVRISTSSGSTYVLSDRDYSIKAFDSNIKDMRDLCGVHFRRGKFPGRKSIVKRLPTQRVKRGVFPSWRCQSSLKPGNERIVEVVPSDLVMVPIEDNAPMNWYLGDGATRCATRAYCTGSEGVRGNSGAVVVTDARTSGENAGITIAGFHAGVSCGTGVVIPLYRDEVEQNMSEFRDEGVDIWDIDYDDWPADVFLRKITEREVDRLIPLEDEELGHVSVTGCIDHHQHAENDRVPSMIQGTFPVTKSPAKLQPFRKEGKTIDPRAVRTKTYTRRPVEIDHDRVARTLRHSFVRHKKHMARAGRIKFPLLTASAAHYGIDGSRFINGLKGASSVGLFAKDALLKSRKRNINKNSEYKDNKEGLVDWVCDKFAVPSEGPDNPFPKEYEEFARDALDRFFKGKRLMIPSVDTLKAETLPNEKVDKGKTRIISAYADVRFVVLFRQLFGTVCDGFFQGAPENGFALGINPYNSDVDRMYAHVTKHGTNNIVAGDHGGFDTRAPHSILSEIVDAFVDIFYPDDDPYLNRFRKYVWLEISENHHISQELVYFPEHGMPSGNPATLIINCIINEIGLRLVYEDCVKAHNLPMTNIQHNFDDTVAFLVCGDDNLLGIHDSARLFFNQLSITKHFATYGYEYTDEDKGVATLPVRHIYDVSFLKRRFVPDESGRHYLLLSLDSIKNQTNWLSEAFVTEVGLKEATRANCESAFREICFYGDHAANVFYDKINAAFMTKGMNFVTIPREPCFVRHGLRNGLYLTRSHEWNLGI
jgi:hypothetical protein